jgi:hypothetical protein
MGKNWRNQAAIMWVIMELMGINWGIMDNKSIHYAPNLAKVCINITSILCAAISCMVEVEGDRVLKSRLPRQKLAQ